LKTRFFGNGTGRAVEWGMTDAATNERGFFKFGMRGLLGLVVAVALPLAVIAQPAFRGMRMQLAFIYLLVVVFLLGWVVLPAVLLRYVLKHRKP